jgi:hypothetical protein
MLLPLLLLLLLLLLWGFNSRRYAVQNRHHTLVTPTARAHSAQPTAAAGCLLSGHLL